LVKILHPQKHPISYGMLNSIIDYDCNASNRWYGKILWTYLARFTSFFYKM